MHVRILGALGLAAIFSLTACGSSGSGTPATLTKAEWVTQANAICKDLNDRSHAVAPKSEADLGTAMTKVSEIASEDIPKIAALKPPAEIQTDAAALVTAYNQINSALKAAAATATAGDPGGAIKAMQASETTLKPTVTALETRLGLTECSRSS
ncbi:hypothetical protein Back2_12920 [Nocardioides baekrokdamisoli]|uniref:Lipoprotein n=1 Tax=Nocardioides baekrokdamisoli TaxID=1804624 RepID=A0A3G9ILW3_9ACTN|nr:hypothetical protein [Nocardioides baekrokdamisoli]BBH17005.1 hypothetical protein Back2_12920 [Nocardioides baekrokdamisoli]